MFRTYAAFQDDRALRHRSQLRQARTRGVAVWLRLEISCAQHAKPARLSFKCRTTVHRASDLSRSTDLPGTVCLPIRRIH